jgi:hypothetical protein
MAWRTQKRQDLRQVSYVQETHEKVGLTAQTLDSVNE